MEVELSPPVSPKISLKSKLVVDSSLQYFPSGMAHPPELPKNLEYRPKSEQLQVYAEWLSEIAKSGFQKPQEPLVKQDNVKVAEEAEKEKERNRARLESKRKELLRQANEANAMMLSSATGLDHSFTDEKRKELASIREILSHTGLTEGELAFAEQRLTNLIESIQAKLQPETTEQKKTPEDEVSKFMEQLREMSKKKMEEKAEEKEREKERAKQRKKRWPWGKIAEIYNNLPPKEHKEIENRLKVIELLASAGATFAISEILKLPPEMTALEGVNIGLIYALTRIIAELARRNDLSIHAEQLGYRLDKKLDNSIDRIIEKYPRLADTLGKFSLRELLPKATQGMIDRVKAFVHSPTYAGVVIGLTAYSGFGFAKELHNQPTTSVEAPIRGNPGQGRVVSGSEPILTVGGNGEKDPLAVINPADGGAASGVEPLPPPLVIPFTSTEVGQGVWDLMLRWGLDWQRLGEMPKDHLIPVVNLLKNLTYGLPQQSGVDIRSIGTEQIVNVLNPDLAKAIVQRFLTALTNKEILGQTLSGVDELLYQLGRVGRHATTADIDLIKNAFSGGVITP